MPRRAERTGHHAVPGAGEPLPARDEIDGYLTTSGAAKLAGVSSSAIRKWRMQGYLATQGLDEQGYPLHSREAVRAADRLVRDLGVLASAVDPQLLRGTAGTVPSVKVTEERARKREAFARALEAADPQRGISPAELVEASGFGRERVGDMLRALVEDGAVTWLRRGAYAPAPGVDIGAALEGMLYKRQRGKAA